MRRTWQLYGARKGGCETSAVEVCGGTPGAQSGRYGVVGGSDIRFLSILGQNPRVSVRLMLNRQRTQISNALRSHLSEFGFVAPIGRNGIERLLVVINDENDARIPADARLCLRMLEAQLRVVKQQILENDRRVRASARESELGRRLKESRASARCWRVHSSRPLPIRTPSSRGDAYRPGSGSFSNRIRAVARRDSAVYPRPAIATCDRCSSSERWRSSALPSGTGLAGHGSCSCWPGERPRLQPLRSPTRLPGWSGH